MELDELKKIWSVYDQKLERNWQLNLHLLRRTNLDKVKSKLSYLIRLNVFNLILSIALGAMYLIFTINNFPVMHFTLAGIVLFLWTAMIAYGAIDQIRIIHTIDYSAPVITIQKKVISLKLVIGKYFRLSIWILPFYTAYIVFGCQFLFGYDIYRFGDQNWWIGQIIISVALFIPLTIWFYRKLSPKHINSSWMKKLISSTGGKQIAEALVLMEEIEAFEEKNDTVEAF